MLAAMGDTAACAWLGCRAAATAASAAMIEAASPRIVLANGSATSA